MFHVMLEHHKSHDLHRLENKDKMISASESNSPLKNNQVKVQLHSIEDPDRKNNISTEDILIDKYTEILELKKFEKLRDELDISQRKKL
jgi:hypothetical protein